MEHCNPSQINAISGFSRSANNAGSSRITIFRPSAGGASGKVARQTYQLLVQSGISPGMISQKTYPGPAKAPVQLTYIRSVAVTKECGDWSSDMANTSSNEPYSNIGCSTQNNIAAMVVNPNDLVVPRQTLQSCCDADPWGYTYDDCACSCKFRCAPPYRKHLKPLPICTMRRLKSLRTGQKNDQRNCPK